MRWRSLAAVVAVLAATGCAADSAEPAASERYYLALGDSLAVGMQPGEQGELVPTSRGYTDALYNTLYDTHSLLRLEKLGCGGEDTTTMIEGGLAHCDYEQGSQLAAAEAFLKEHAGDVALVTLDIGANNFTSCAYDAQTGELTTTIDQSCVEDGLDRLRAETTVIAERLRAAAGADVPIVAMNYYNPFLAIWLLGGTAAGTGTAPSASPAESSAAPSDGGRSSKEVARYTNEVQTELNKALADAYAEYGIEVADVAAAFDSQNFEVPASSETGMPANVAAICRWTWMCSTSAGPDIHANDAGYREIAKVFAHQVDLG